MLDQDSVCDKNKQERRDSGRCRRKNSRIEQKLGVDYDEGSQMTLRFLVRVTLEDGKIS